jgi:hypothetical protein
MSDPHDMARQVYAFLAESDRDDMRIVLDAVTAGVLASRDREREYAAKCDGAMMAALALASKSRISPDLARTLSMRIGANLLPADGRSALEREFIASAIEAATAGETSTQIEGSTEGESAVPKADAQPQSPNLSQGDTP